jgi:hypothetical protein
MATSTTFYDEVVRITHNYLGPAADRFVARQIHNHLDKRPEELHVRDMPVLIDWIRLSMSLLSDDEHEVSGYIADLRNLAK